MAKRKRSVSMTLWDRIFSWLLITGGLNWGIIGITRFFDGDFNLVESIMDAIGFPIISTLVYALVGFSAVWITVRAMNGFK